ISRPISNAWPLALACAAALATSACGRKPGLRITDIDPKVGPSTGGSLVTVQGSGFQEGGVKGVKVYFGDHEASRVYIDGDDKIKVEPPPGEVGKTVDLMFLFDDAKTLTYPKAYTYQDFTQNNARDQLFSDKDKAGESGETAKPDEAAK